MAQENVFSDLIPAQAGTPTAQPQAGGFRPLTDGPPKPTTYRQLTPDEVKARGLDPEIVYQISPDGNVSPVGGQTKQTGVKPTEAESTAAFLGSRVAYELNSIKDATGGNIAAASPGMLTEGVRSVFGDTAANFLTGADRQRVEAAQLNLLDAALTLGTGAAYTSEQLDGYRRSHFPQLGDDDKVKEDKKKRLLMLLEAAKVKAGNAAPKIDEAMTALGLKTPTAQDAVTGTDAITQEVAGVGVPEFMPDGSVRVKEQDGRITTYPTRDLYEKYKDGGPGDPRLRGTITDESQYNPAARDTALGAVDAFGRGVADAATLGFADEIAAVGDTVTGGGTYLENLSKQRRTDKLDESVNPWARVAGQVTGALALPVSAEATTGRAMAEGGAYSAAYGAGSSEGDLGDRAISAAGYAVPGIIGGWAGAKWAHRSKATEGMPTPPSNAALVDMAKRQGIDLPAGSLGPGMSVTEHGMSILPGSSGPIRRARERLSGQVEQRVEGVASIAGKADGNRGLGDAAQTGVKNAMERGKDQAKALYDDVPISPDFKSEMPATVDYLESLSLRYGSNPKFQANKVDSSLVKDYEALKDGGLSWNDLKEYRSSVGEQMGEAMISDGRSRKDLSGLYAALTYDMENMAKAAGPEALTKFRRANDFFKQRQAKIEGAFQEIIGKDMQNRPEEAAKKLRAMLTDGNATADLNSVATLRGAMTKDEWGDVQSGLIRMMGQPMQAEAKEFSPQTFIGVYSRMTSKARNIVFGSKGELRSSLDEFSTVLERIAKHDALRNTSNTAPNIVGAAVPATAFGTGGMAAVGAALPGLLKFMALANISARAWTSPKFVRLMTGVGRMVEGSAKAGGKPNVAKQSVLFDKVMRAEPAIASDILGLQRALSQAFEGAAAQTPMKAAAEDQQPQPPR